MAKITKVEQTLPTIKEKKKVAAYARVSMESERMNHSLDRGKESSEDRAV